MSDGSIRLSEEVKAHLDRHRRAGESDEDVILRLTERDPWAGFGALAECDQDTREGIERLHDEVHEGIRRDLERST